jgi:hypothetical protein
MPHSLNRLRVYLRPSWAHIQQCEFLSCLGVTQNTSQSVHPQGDEPLSNLPSRIMGNLTRI